MEALIEQQNDDEERVADAEVAEEVPVVTEFNAMAEEAKDPLWKVASILEELRKNCQQSWVTGKCVSIDEMTIGFKVKHGLPEDHLQIGGALSY